MCTCCWWVLVVYLSGCWEKHEKQLNLKRRLFNAGLIVLSTASVRRSAFEEAAVFLHPRVWGLERVWGIQSIAVVSSSFESSAPAWLSHQPPSWLQQTLMCHPPTEECGHWVVHQSTEHVCTSNMTLNCTGKPDACHKKVILNPASLQLQTLSQQCNFLQHLKFPLPFKDSQSSVCSKVLKLC